jgi:hypothetical protein
MLWAILDVATVVVVTLGVNWVYQRIMRGKSLEEMTAEELAIGLAALDKAIETKGGFDQSSSIKRPIVAAQIVRRKEAKCVSREPHSTLTG